MLTRIAEQTKVLERYLEINAVLLPTDKKHLQQTIELLKKTYRQLPTGEVAPILSYKKIAKLLRKIQKKMKNYYDSTSISDPYKKLLNRVLDYLDCFFYLEDMLDDQEGIERIAPISQASDDLVGIGQCYGYVLKWSEDMFVADAESRILNNISFANMSEEKYVAFTAPFFRHSIPITPEIIRLQRQQYQFWRIETLGLYFQRMRDFTLFTSSVHFTDQLLSLANKNPDQLVDISLTNYFVYGHALGLMKKNDHFHFLDANQGYYRFQNADIFKNWFTKYFHSYSFVFHAANVRPLDKKPQKPNHKTLLSQGVNIMQQTLYFFMAFPIAAAVIICSTLLLFIAKVVLQPWNIYRYVAANHALAAESRQVFEEVVTLFHKNGSEKNRARLNKAPFFFSEEVSIEIKPTPEKPKNKTTASFCQRFFCLTKSNKNNESNDNAINVATFAVNATP